MEPSFSWFLVFAVDPLGTDPLLLGLEPTRVHHIYLSNLNSNPSTIGSSMHKPLREFFAKHLAQLGCADLVMFIFPVPVNPLACVIYRNTIDKFSFFAKQIQVHKHVFSEVVGAGAFLKRNTAT